MWLAIRLGRRMPINQGIGREMPPINKRTRRCSEHGNVCPPASVEICIVTIERALLKDAETMRRSTAILRFAAVRRPSTHHFAARIWFESLESRRLFSAPGFGIDGIGAAWFQASIVNTMDFALAPDGKIVVVGQVYGWVPHDDPNSQPRYWGLARLNPDGSRDTTFGDSGNGTLILPLSNASVASHVLIQPDGRIIVTGTRDRDVVVARFNVDGSPDTTFSGGFVSDSHFDFIFSGDPWQGAAWLNPDDGRITLMGVETFEAPTTVTLMGTEHTVEESFSGIRTVRLNPDGTPDNTFGPGGTVTTALGPSWSGSVIFLAGQPLSDGGALIYLDNWNGELRPDNGPHLMRVELDAHGHLISSATFDPVIPTMEPGDAGGYSGADYNLTLAGDGSAYATSGMNDPRIQRFDPTGAVDQSFGEHGVVTTPMSFITGTAVTADGKLLVEGGRIRANDYHLQLFDPLLLRLNSDGSPDPTFNAGQPIIDDLLGCRTLFHPLPDGSTFRASAASAYFSRAFAVEKLLADGSVAPSAHPKDPDHPETPFDPGLVEPVDSESDGDPTPDADFIDASDPDFIDAQDFVDLTTLPQTDFGGDGSPFAVVERDDQTVFNSDAGFSLFD
jgi:uncharacterized delta-60 repeat protein